MKWKYNKRDKIWKKQIHHSHIVVTDGWGVSSDEKYNYSVDTYLYKCFSFKNGFWYQVIAPNFVSNDKTIDGVLKYLFIYLYREGGTCCYQRLEDELMSKGLWRKLG